MWAVFLAFFGGSWGLFSKNAGAAFFNFFPVPQPQPIKTQPRSEFSVSDLDTLARTLWGEARGEGSTGMQAVANVVMNRYDEAKTSNAKARQYGASVAEICRKPYQFSAWNANDPNFSKMLALTEADPLFNKALNIARAALNNSLSDITRGANHYHTAAVSPKWSIGVQPIAQVGNHKFFALA